MNEHGAAPRGAQRPLPDIDSRVPQAARVYDYLLGGTVNFRVDREAAEEMAAVLPGGMASLRSNARANRRFLGRAVERLAGDLGIRQFLDIGTGIPADDNVHAVAGKVAPDSRVVYVDNDPMVLAHAHILLKRRRAGAAAYLNGDIREPELIVEQAAETLDFREPIALMLVAILHLVADEDDPYGIVAHLVDRLPRGSYVAISHLTTEFEPKVVEAGAEVLSRVTGASVTLRSAAEVARFFDGLDLVEPGLAQVDQWNAGRTGPPPLNEPGGWVNNIYCGFARKP